MKIIVDDQVICEVNATQMKVIKNDIPEEIFDTDMARRCKYMAEVGQYKHCHFNRKKHEEMAKEQGLTSVPTDNLKLGVKVCCWDDTAQYKPLKCKCGPIEFEISEDHQKMCRHITGLQKKEIEDYYDATTGGTDEERVALLKLALPSRKKEIDKAYEFVKPSNEQKKKEFVEEIINGIGQTNLSERMVWILNEKHRRCMERLRLEWVPKFEAIGMTEFPVDEDAFSELVFAQPGYMSRSQREARGQLLSPKGESLQLKDL